MNKFLQKTVGKWKLWSVIAAAVAVIGIVLTAIFGFNLSSAADNNVTLTVRLDSYASNAVVEKVENICETEFEKLGLSYDYEVKAQVSNGSVREYVYTFHKSVDVNQVESAKNAINVAFDAEKKNAESPLYNGFVGASFNSNQTVKFLAKGFVWRAAVAFVAVLAVIFVYCAFRLKWHLAFTVTAATFVGELLTVAIVGATRIPVTASVVYAFAFSALFTAALAILFAGNMKAAFKQEENKDKSVEEVVVAATPASGITLFAAVLLVALVLVGAIAVTPVSWVAIASVVGLISGTFTTLVLLPAVYVPVKKAVAASAAKRARYDYKKSAKKNEEVAE